MLDIPVERDIAPLFCPICSSRLEPDIYSNGRINDVTRNCPKLVKVDGAEWSYSEYTVLIVLSSGIATNKIFRFPNYAIAYYNLDRGTPYLIVSEIVPVNSGSDSCPIESKEIFFTYDVNMFDCQDIDTMRFDLKLLATFQ